jgi:hypothetical protein
MASPSDVTLTAAVDQGPHHHPCLLNVSVAVPRGGLTVIAGEVGKRRAASGSLAHSRAADRRLRLTGKGAAI